MNHYATGKCGVQQFFDSKEFAQVNLSLSFCKDNKVSASSSVINTVKVDIATDNTTPNKDFLGVLSTKRDKKAVLVHAVAEEPLPSGSRTLAVTNGMVLAKSWTVQLVLYQHEY
jgi:hypothetical protein